jgi:hypothetical protein
LVPIIEKGKKTYSMFPDFLKYPWVIKPPIYFTSIEKLQQLISTKIIPLAEKKQQSRQKQLEKRILLSSLTLCASNCGKGANVLSHANAFDVSELGACRRAKLMPQSPIGGHTEEMLAFCRCGSGDPLEGADIGDLCCRHIDPRPSDDNGDLLEVLPSLPRLVNELCRYPGPTLTAHREIE